MSADLGHRETEATERGYRDRGRVNGRPNRTALTVVSL
jgi:hypothetical protein